MTKKTQDNRVPELVIGEIVRIENNDRQGNKIVEGMAKVKEIIDFSLDDKVYDCMVEFTNEPGNFYRRFIWL